jgi:hypothetical protein
VDGDNNLAGSKSDVSRPLKLTAPTRIQRMKLTGTPGLRKSSGVALHMCALIPRAVHAGLNIPFRGRSLRMMAKACPEEMNRTTPISLMPLRAMRILSVVRHDCPTRWKRFSPEL